MVDSSNMDFISVFSLIFAILSTGHSNTQVISDSCYKLCPPGYHKVGDCNGQVKEYRCEKCDNSSYTEKENSLTKCNRCDACGHYEKEIKPCSFDGDVVCDCKDEYYNANPNSNFRNCQECRCTNCEWSDKSDYFKKCKPCERCPQCQHKCATTTSTNTSTSTLATPSTTSTTSTTSTFMTKTTTRTTPNNKLDPETTQAPTLTSVHRLFFVGAVVAFLVLFWFLLMFTRNPIRYPESFPCWNVKKDLELASEDLKLNEQPSHHGSCPTSLTINISEETPMMALSQSPATLEHPQHIGLVLPDAEHKATRQAEQSEHWPAIVLYAIIKEVPLRRWKEFLRLLSVADQQLERVELEAGLGSIERQYQMLRLWSQRSSANLNDIFSALHYMDLSGCAQLLQESLDKLQWRPDLKQRFTHHGLNGATQDT